MHPIMKQAIAPFAPKDDPKDNLLDLIEAAIDDSMDIDWTTRVGAEHVYRAMEREGMVQRLHALPAVLKALIDLELYLRETPHHNAPQAAAARAAIARAVVRSNEYQL